MRRRSPFTALAAGLLLAAVSVPVAATAVGPDDGALLMSSLIGGYVPRRR